MLLFFFGTTYAGSWASQVAQWIKNKPAMQETAGDVGLIPGWLAQWFVFLDH